MDRSICYTLVAGKSSAPWFDTFIKGYLSPQMSLKTALPHESASIVLYLNTDQSQQKVLSDELKNAT